MEMDVYNCEECTRAFAVEKGTEVTCCPGCESDLFEFSHDVICGLDLAK